MDRVKVKRDENNLPVLTRQPKLSAYVETYFKTIGESKKPGTIEKEKTILARWTEKYGDMRIDQIKRVHVNRFIESRLEKKISPRTINLDVIGLRVVLKKALSEQLIQRLPTEGLKPLKTTTSKRSLFTAAELEKLCSAAFETKKDGAGKTVPLTENEQQFVDYVRVMAYCGSRRNETFGIKWDDVDTDNGQLFIRRQVTERGIETLKNSEQRSVDFNPKLRALLADMKERRVPDSEWLFPSP
jgi:integrase